MFPALSGVNSSTSPTNDMCHYVIAVMIICVMLTVALFQRGSVDKFKTPSRAAEQDFKSTTFGLKETIGWNLKLRNDEAKLKQQLCSILSSQKKKSSTAAPPFVDSVYIFGEGGASQLFPARSGSNSTPK